MEAVEEEEEVEEVEEERYPELLDVSCQVLSLPSHWHVIVFSCRGRRRSGQEQEELQVQEQEQGNLQEQEQEHRPSSRVSSLNQPSTGCLISSEIPKLRAPMKSFLEVRSQSHTSTWRRAILKLLILV